MALISACSGTPIRADAGDGETGARPWRVAVGAEVQAYPAGIIPGVHAQFPLSESGVLTTRLAYDATDRQDFGEHDNEDGGGPGGGVGYRHYFGPDYTGWLLGGRVDLWFLDIDWEDDPPAIPAKDSTDVIVLQPTVEGGYGFRVADRLRLDLTVGVGAEINIDEDGDDVGEGAIGLAGITLVYEF